LVRGFALTAELAECDLVVNLPKLKTHRLMKYTGAIKNLFGLIPGLGKSGFHLRFPDSADFGTMLVDLAAAVPDCFTFMDGIVAMEGEGPGDGDPYELGVVLASAEPAALDWIAASCVGYDPRRLPYLVDAIGRTGRDPAAPIISVGPASLAELAVDDFKLLPYDTKGESTAGSLPAIAKGFLKRALMDRPIFDPRRCEGCSACVVVCPAKALELEKNGLNRVLIDDKACIGCFCCHEVCPAHAIRIGKLFRRPSGARRRK
jgi:ferredoxin